ncbi:glycine/D-amino acid oxidase-like deaminating enzyme [Arcticibacter tournemirensis]|uniref:FAD-dependent oxidoreductase n=1 Tax=Arcticibacter tournemirensis TaxID=699437 RepID=A0A5M9H9E1_9SPHI|nr:FAD-dependent oxidoreductase [Arcticibacter tournemirensis]KAA8481874.1 FAD-dependent oxidoreductase [Arcticibacter tournemirensis]TQM52204.1 glycine/D-amino acid oxidase-like deaminating enzyme [Arcticibacter tournemirensis]
MENPSVWRDEVHSPAFPQLSGDISADVVIIGGGITGITAAYLLSIAGKSVVVLESNKVGQSSTGFSTGNLYASVGGEGLHSISSKFNEAKLIEVVESRAAAVDLIEEIIAVNDIECDFKRVSWNLFSVEGQRQSFINDERTAAAVAGLTVSSHVPYTSPVKDGFAVPNQAQFNPLKYVVSLASKIDSESCRIFEHSRVVKVEEGETCTVETEHGKVTAPKVIMATHTPKGLYMVHASMGPYREYAVAAIATGSYPEAGIYWEMQETEHYSVRTYDSPHGKIIMVLGEMHKVGQKEENLECYHKLEAFLRKRFDVGDVVYRWSAQQYKPADSIPYIGLSSGDSKTYIATGFGADGLVYGTLAAMIISDSILEKPNKWSKTYDASRITLLASASNFIKENANVAYEMVKDLLTTDADSFAEVRTYEGKIMELEGSKYAVHRDGDGELHIVTAICPHMGCVVHWNTAEQSWDCPCHGSRFSKHGDVLEGPAINPLKKVVI